MEIRPDLARDLGTGFGSPRSLAALSAGQLRKRSALLRMLVDDAATTEGTRRSGLATAYRYLSATGQLDELLAYPNLGVWLARCGHRLAEPPGGDDRGAPLWADLGYLGWLAAAHLVASGRAGSAEVVVRDGAVMLPGLGLARLAEAGTHGAASLTVSQGRLEMTTDDARLVVRDPGAGTDERWLPLRRLGATYSGPRTVYLDDLDPFRDVSDPEARARLAAPAPRLTATQAVAWSRAFLGALEILRRQHPGYSAGIDHLLRTVVPLTAEPVADGVSDTSPHAYGSVAMSAAGGPHQFALTLILQCQRAKFAALTDQVELQKPSAAEDLYAPWRDDPRPLSGLLQETYAQLGVADFWRAFRTEAGAHGPAADVEFARRRAQVDQALRIAGASPLLTDAGKAFVEAMSAAVRRRPGETVPRRLESLARQASARHRVAWRVRNLTADLGPLHVRWKAGQDPGPLPESHVVSPAALPGATERASGPRTGAADRAYDDGEYEEALTLYTAELGDRPRRPESWAGIALSLRHLTEEASVAALFRRPEVVAGLYEAEPCDIVQLTAWLSGALPR